MHDISKDTNNIRLKIPHGGIAEISKISGASRSTIEKVLDGKSSNKKALQGIATYLDDLAKATSTIKTALTAL